MLRKIFLFLALSVSAGLLAREKSNVKITGFASPESVIAGDKYIYVSNVGIKLEPMKKDSDGFISRLSFDGKIQQLKFISGLDAPKGMAIAGNVLYVADIDKVKGFDLTSAKEIFSLDFSPEKTGFLNDLCLKDNTHLFVSATDISQLFEIDLVAKSYRPLELTQPIASPNGLYYDQKLKTLYVASFGEKGKIMQVFMDGRKNKTEELWGVPGNYDGIYSEGEMVYFSDWGSNGKGRLKQLNATEKKEKDVVLAEAGEFSGPADFWYDKPRGLIWVPEMQKGVVWRLQVPRHKKKAKATGK